MLTMHPTLLIGPSDWQPDVMPRTEFVERIDALWANHPQAERAIVFGNSAHHAELAYFTNFVPKLEAAVAILSRTHERRLLVGGGVNMMAAARPLTFIEDVLPLKDVGDAIRAGQSSGHTLLVGADYMPTGFRRAVTEAIGPRAIEDATAQVWSQMSRKSPREIDAICRASATMGAGTSAMIEALRLGANVSAVVGAGEQAAYADGAQDVRTLFSLDGGRTFRPFFAPFDAVVEPLHVYLAVRRFNYWVEDFPLLARDDDVDDVLGRAIVARNAACRLIKAGAPAPEIAATVEAAIRPCGSHSMTAQALAQRVGLALDERPYTDLGPTFEDREVYSLRIGVTDGRSLHHIVGATIRVREGRNDLL